ncbi:hypothetical protein [Klebsiella pneumoniae]|uniref:hypothetical protein n=1 Tax=Klebsiella pneumoniae TaxID=573 RepID=UPI0015CEB563|nr:hypothetical protein [Klebsiella pneumoniae]
MKVLIKLSNDWPEHVSGNPVLDKWVHKIPWSGIECFLLCEDGNVYQLALIHIAEPTRP